MEFPTDQSNNYRVEVSGWDERENFFVEKTLLTWERDGQKELTVRTALRAGCVVFVRLLQPVAGGTNFPIAYQAVNVAAKDRSGRSRVSVQQLRPRERGNEGQREPQESIVQVA